MAKTCVKCPTCRREIDWSASEFRPFCSERCRLIDLGAWLSEKHAIPGDTPEAEGDPEHEDSDRRHGGS
ncbi:MAG: DNA gyrase inhibitor YacG [Steroidobacteraceae bacterium]